MQCILIRNGYCGLRESLPHHKVDVLAFRSNPFGEVDEASPARSVQVSILRDCLRRGAAGCRYKKAAVVLRTDTVTAFVGSHQWPNNPGHVIVIPNEHIENLYSLPSSLDIPIQEAI